MGSAPAVVVPVRLHADMYGAVKALAETEETSVSEIVREALRDYRATPVAVISQRTGTGRLLTAADLQGRSAPNVGQLGTGQPDGLGGMMARIVVPFRGVESISRTAPMASARSCRVDSP